MDSTTLKTLEIFPQQLEAHYTAIPEAYKHWSPPSWEGIPSEPLTAIEQICHVRDIEIEGYHVRFHRTLNESHPTLASLDTEGLARERSYGAQDVTQAFLAFREARIQTITLLSTLTPNEWHRTAVFEGYGSLTLLSLVHYLCSHDQQHLAGLQWLLGKIEASRA
jgi:DinB superfamily